MILPHAPHSPVLIPPATPAWAQLRSGGGCSEEEQAELSLCLLWSPLHEALVETTVQDANIS